MVALQVVAILAVTLLAYSIAWEAVRYVRLDRARQAAIVRGLLSVIAFIVAAALWPAIFVVFLIKYRTPWPVTGGRLVPPGAM